MDETDGAKVTHLLRLRLRWDEYYVRSVKLAKAPTIPYIQLLDIRHHVIFDNVPSLLIKGSNEPIHPRCSVRWQLLNCVPNFLLFKKEKR